MKFNLTMKETLEKIAEKSKTIGLVFEQAGEDLDFSGVKCLGGGDTTAKVDALKALETELNDLKADYEEYTALVKSRQEADAATEFVALDPRVIPGKQAAKSLGERFVDLKLHLKENMHSVKHLDMELKTLFQTSAGWDPEATRIPRVELYPLRPLVVTDFIPILTTNTDLVKYMKETTFTNNAAEAAAGGTYGEAALAYTETSDEVEKIGVWLPVTDEQLEDVPSIGGLLDNRLTYMLRNRLDGQAIEGDGSTPNLLGTLNLSSIQSQAKGADPTPDAIYKAFTKVRAVGFAEPSVLFINPNDWQDIRLLRTADGIYVFGNPTEAGPERIWGVRVVQSTAVTVNTAITGDYVNYSALYMRRGIDIQVTNAHDDYFIKGKQAIRADLRCAMVHYRDTAFCKVTGI